MSQADLTWYEGTAKPDRRDMRDNSDSHRLECLLTTFRSWVSFLVCYAVPYDAGWMDIPKRDMLLEEACRIVEPFVDSLPAVLGKEYVLPLYDMKQTHGHYAGYGGLFYTALLNMGKDERILVTTISGIGLWGYRLKKGRIILASMQPSTYDFIGEAATGGIIENLGIVSYLGREGWGATYINSNTVLNECGFLAQNGLFINHGRVTGWGNGATGGVFVNHGLVDAWAGLKASALFLTYDCGECILSPLNHAVAEEKTLLDSIGTATAKKILDLPMAQLYIEQLRQKVCASSL
ncbi:hypothetical protein HY639_03945 [Candidatus Woesearchaeota archaeon]|nr:hypothetical protein [Candidatus Woesearchaeota archaeon]